MSFERWENRMHDDYVGEPEYEPDEHCPCGCEGDFEACTFDPDDYDDTCEAEYLADRYEDPNDPFRG